jgi:hypothetical protein
MIFYPRSDAGEREGRRRRREVRAMQSQAGTERGGREEIIERVMGGVGVV